MRISLITGLMFVGLSVATAAEAQTIKLRVADSFPAGHYIPDSQTKWWMEEVTRATSNTVQFEYYPAEQLGKAKDLLSLTMSGVIDIGYVAPSFVPDKLPLSQIAELPLGFSDACSATMAFFKEARSGLLYEKEYRPAKIRVLFAVLQPPYQLFLRRGPIDDISTWKNLKIRVSGSGKELAVRSFGGVPIQIATPDIYQALSRGTIDGALFPFTALMSYDLQGLVKAGTIGENLGNFVAMYVIEEGRFQTYPQSVQQAMLTAGDEATRRGCERLDGDENRDIARVEKAGVKLSKLSQQSHNDLAKLLAPIAETAATNLDRRGQAGSELLKELRKAASEPPAKQ